VHELLADTALLQLGDAVVAEWALVAFLGTLTDGTLATDARLADSFPAP
jgi:hypothetical protein